MSPSATFLFNTESGTGVNLHHIIVVIIIIVIISSSASTTVTFSSDTVSLNEK